LAINQKYGNRYAPFASPRARTTPTTAAAARQRRLRGDQLSRGLIARGFVAASIYRLVEKFNSEMIPSEN